MSYAVIQTGGKQYKVKSGDILKIEKLPETKPETKIEFKDILAYGDDKLIEVGAPTVSGAKVEAELIKNGKKRTLLIFKKRRRHNSRKKNGHRQHLSVVQIQEITVKGKTFKDTKKKKDTELKKDTDPDKITVASKELKNNKKEVEIKKNTKKKLK